MVGRHYLAVGRTVAYRADSVNASPRPNDFSVAQAPRGRLVLIRLPGRLKIITTMRKDTACPTRR
jgi:hypothetical protein